MRTRRAPAPRTSPSTSLATQAACHPGALVCSRVFIFVWSFSGLVLATLYMAALHRMVTTDTDDTVFHTLDELAESDIPKFATAEHVRAYK